MSDLALRIATDQDCERISMVLFEAFQEVRHLYTNDAIAATVISPAEVRRRMQEGPLWVAEYEGKVVGTVSLVFRGNKEAYVRGMAVLPAAQGLKIGLLLLQAAEQFALGNHCDRLFLRTTPYLSKAIRLYERFGFAASEGEEDFFGTPSFLMEKRYPPV